MRKLFSVFLVAICFLMTAESDAASKERRTDGPPGSEWGDFSNWDGQFQIAGKFGASFLTNGKKTSFLLGADLDYRPSDPFGFRMSFDQSLQKPRISLIHLTPVLHTQFYNFRPYALFGPGIAIVSGRGDTAAKFSLDVGLGGDFMLTDKIGLGMIWNYYFLIDSIDVSSIAARISYWF